MGASVQEQTDYSTASQRPIYQLPPAKTESLEARSLDRNLSRVELVKKYLPEYKQVLERAGGHKPRKFLEAVKVKLVPVKFNPTGLSDYAVRKSFSWDGTTLTEGPMYSYDSMINVVKDMSERVISSNDVGPGMRVWITTYDGGWGGYWSSVLVFVNEADPIAVYTYKFIG